MVQQRSQTVLRIQKLLEESNIKLDSVLTDVMGVSGRAMLKGLSEGESDAETLAALAVPQLRGKTRQLVEALEGTMKTHQRFVLKQWLSSFEELDRHVTEVEREIEAYAIPFEHQIARLDEIPGVNRIGAIAILSEIGVDMSAFAIASNLCAWAGVCSGNNETAGKRRKAKARRGNRWLRGILTQCAWAATRTKTSYFQAQYRKLVGRCGHNKTIVATAHSMLAIIWHMLKRDEPYRDLGVDYFDRLNTQSKQRAYVRKLEQLGYKVILQPVA
jgi:transposase